MSQVRSLSLLAQILYYKKKKIMQSSYICDYIFRSYNDPYQEREGNPHQNREKEKVEYKFWRRAEAPCCWWRTQGAGDQQVVTRYSLFVNIYPTLNLLNFLNGQHIFTFGTVHWQFYRYQDENMKLAYQQYWAWSDCKDVQAVLVAKLITFNASRIRVSKLVQLQTLELSIVSFEDSKMKMGTTFEHVTMF